MKDLEVEQFKTYCDKFLDYVIKYSYKENIYIQKEQKAYQNGIISKQSFDKLKNARQQAILSYNKLAYNFKKASEDANLKNSNLGEKLNNILQAMLVCCESSIL